MELGIVSNIGCLKQRTALMLAVASMMFVLKSTGHAQTEVRKLNSTEVDEIVDHLQVAVQNYIFPEVGRV
jgi:hypothetical protein